MGVWHGIWTLILLIVFLGIVAWAWSAKQKKRFDEAGRLPLDDDKTPSTAQRNRVENDDG